MISVISFVANGFRFFYIFKIVYLKIIGFDKIMLLKMIYKNNYTFYLLLVFTYDGQSL